MTPSYTRTYALGTLAIMASLVSWGISFPLAKYVMQTVDIWTLLFWRLLLGFIVASPFLVLKYQPIKKHHMGTVFVWGMALIPVCLFLQFQSLLYTSSSIASLAIGVEFPFVVFWLYALYKKRPTRADLWITLLAFFGLALIVGDIELGSLLGVLFVLGGGISFALGSVLSDKVASEYNPIFTTTIAMGFGVFFFAVPWILWGTTSASDIALQTYGAIAFMGIVNSFLTIFLWTYGVKRIGATRAAQYVVIEPLVGAMTGIIWLGEYWYWGTIIGAIMVTISIVLDSTAHQKQS